MKRDKINIILGIIILLTPFSGFPREFKTVILSISALVIIAIALQEIRKEHKKKTSETPPPDAYVESKPAKSFDENFQAGKPFRTSNENIGESVPAKIQEEILQENTLPQDGMPSLPTLPKKRTYTRRIAKENLSTISSQKNDRVGIVSNIINE